LLALSRDQLDDANVLHEVKKLLRAAINHYLGDKSLHTRDLIRAMHRVSSEPEKSS
jgi:recombinational DNA repair protein (RecF pathway)